MGGKNRLIDIEIDKLQVYYVLAVRRGGSSLDDMKGNIWATYFQKLSADKTS